MFPVDQPQHEHAQALLKGTRMMPCVKMLQADTMAGPLDTFTQRPEPVIPKILSEDILPAGELKVGPLAQPGAESSLHLCHEARPTLSTWLRCTALGAPPSLALALWMPSCCCAPPPPPFFGTDLKPPQVTQWAMRLGVGFVKMMPF